MPGHDVLLGASLHRRRCGRCPDFTSCRGVFTSCKGVRAVRVVSIGPPGAGKGTPAQKLSEKLGVPQISTGDLVRHHIGASTELRLRAKRYLDAGYPVPTALTNALVEDRPSQADAARGFILDGFPRSVEQADALMRMLNVGRRQVGIERRRRISSVRGRAGGSPRGTGAAQPSSVRTDRQVDSVSIRSARTVHRPGPPSTRQPHPDTAGTRIEPACSNNPNARATADNPENRLLTGASILCPRLSQR